MLAIHLIKAMDPEFIPEHAKIHLATWNGKEDPFDEYLAGRFNDWQRWQTKRNFERSLVVSLIAIPSKYQWLYAGVFAAKGYEWHEERSAYCYVLEPQPSCLELVGRLVINFERTGRQSYLNMESWADKLSICEITRERVSIVEFPGFKAVNLSKNHLDVVVKNQIESWRTALSSVAGVYLISDKTSGKLYVGSACGEGGIWQRWSQYSISGHGGNVELIDLLEKEGGLGRANAFRFSILEIADVHATQNDIIRRESHWKNILLAREHGLNAN